MSWWNGLGEGIWHVSQSWDTGKDELGRNTSVNLDFTGVIDDQGNVSEHYPHIGVSRDYPQSPADSGRSASTDNCSWWGGGEKSGKKGRGSKGSKTENNRPRTWWGGKPGWGGKPDW